MQWKGMDWPILVDSYNRLEVAAVPITLLIDEYGIIRDTRPRKTEIEPFVETEFPEPNYQAPSTIRIMRGRHDLVRDLDWEPEGSPEKSTHSGYPGNWSQRGTNVTLRGFDFARRGLDIAEWGGADKLGVGIGLMTAARDLVPDDGWIRFRLGVAWRKQFDSKRKLEGDFARAVDNWTKALDLDPNQYIWRRRIQQYGPRLDKPYPFYDWVPTARKEIKARGETPVSLAVEPVGAEFAVPLGGRLEPVVDTPGNPDPGGRIQRDKERLVGIETTLVPSTKGAKTAYRTHVVMTPDFHRSVHWNNEAEGVVVWLDRAKGWTLERQVIVVPNGNGELSVGAKSVDFEIRPEGSKEGRDAEITGYALYYLCEDLDGVCVYRRQDFSIKLK